MREKINYSKEQNVDAREKERVRHIKLKIITLLIR